MDNNRFEQWCREIVADYFNTKFCNNNNMSLNPEDVRVVWLSKVLGNNKALLITGLPDGMYYEVTYNGERDEAYVDVYGKRKNYVVYHGPR